MTTDSPDSARRIFLAARELADDQRAEFLAAECGNDSALRKEVESLLANDVDDFVLRKTELARSVKDYVSDRPPSRIGDYKILEQIGEGGMGVVYRAERQEPVKQRVALKVIKLGMDTREFIARFKMERQALALMNHPAIAQIHDAGATEDGRPFFVMEDVPGVAITEHCDRERLSTKQRLELFVEVCDAVQHAHSKGVIHRDLKPSNVLVSSYGGTTTPKIIDFGVAKLTSPWFTPGTVYTEVGRIIGTREYMSPEQVEARGQDIDTTTDVYSLGVLLYELLVGTTPFERVELDKLDYEQLRRQIRDVDPPKPSTRVSSLGGAETNEVARRHHTDPDAFTRELRGDLDWITMKALAKNRQERYGTASELAADIGRHLRDEPVTAGAPGVGYQLGKFVRRHRTGVVVASLLVGTLVIGAVGTGLGWARASKAERQMARQVVKTQRLAKFTQSLLSGIDPVVAKGLDTRLLRRILEDAMARLDDELADDPEIRGSILATVGEAYTSIGELVPSAQALTESLALLQESLPADHPDLGNAFNLLGNLATKKGEHEQARPYYERALAIRRSAFGSESPEVAATMKNLGETLLRLGEMEASRELLEQALAIRQNLAADGLEVAYSLSGLSRWYLKNGQKERALELAQQSQNIREQNLPASHDRVARGLWAVGRVQLAIEQRAEARSTYERMLEIFRIVLGNAHPDTAYAAISLGQVCEALDDVSAALNYCEEGLAVDRRAPGDTRGNVMEDLGICAGFLTKLGRDDEAQAYLREAKAIEAELAQE